MKFCIFGETKRNCHLEVTAISNKQFSKLTVFPYVDFCGIIFQKPVNANLGLKVNQGLCFSF